MMNKLKNDSGITLMTLVITIIVLLILSTVAISSGKQTIENTKLTTFTAEMKIMQTHVNELYDKYINNGTITIDKNSYTGNDESNGIQNIGKDANDYSYSKAESYIRKNSYGDLEKYRVYTPELLQYMGIDGIKQTFLVNVPERKVVSAKGLKYEGRMYYTLEQLPEGLYNVEYTENNTIKPEIKNINFEYIGEDKWRIMVSDIEYGGYISKWNVQYKLEDEANWHTSSETSFIVKKAGKYDIKVFNDKVESKVETLTVDHSEVKVSTIEKTGVFANDNIEEVRGGNIPIPKDYTYVKGDKIGGAVITDGTSEFVWIPVDDIKEMAVLQDDSTTNYRGVLYNWVSDKTGNTPYEWTPDSTIYREPANLDSYDTADNVTGWTSTLYQEEYNKMVTSVAKYGGFYVGRYETSLNNATDTDTGGSDSTSVQSKAGVKSANAILPKTKSWYGLYNMSKTYAPESDTSKSVVSSMIWGSQYDAMMRWMQGNGIDVTSNDSAKLNGAVRNSSNTRVTGAKDSKDILNNIYDLLGNNHEWTQEAGNTIYRGYRGGCYDSNYNSNFFFPSSRYGTVPTNVGDLYGSRLTLYIK